MPDIRSMFCVCVLSGAALAQAPAKVDFVRDIQPLFRQHCIECHGPSQQMRGLRLDRRRSAMPNRVGANGARIVAGNSARSPIYRRVSGPQSGAQMPPAGPLRAEEINLIKAWIDQGADWPDELSGDHDLAPADPGVVSMAGALRSGNRREFERILRQQPAVVHAKGASGWTPLMYAALYGNVEAARALLEKGAKPNTQNDEGGTALMYAVESEEITRLLLANGADPNVRSGEGRTALLIGAGRAGSYPVVRLLLEKGAKAGVRLADGRGVLTAAVGSRDPEVYQLLLEHGAEKKAVPLSPLLTAGCAACFDLLLPFADPSDLAAGLQGAIRAGDLPRIQLLFDRGVRSPANLLGIVALSPAAIPADTIRKFISSGADVNLKSAGGVTLLEFAQRQGNTVLIEELRHAGVRDEVRLSTPLRPQPAGSARAAVERVLPALQRADAAFLDKAGCVSCHNNSLTAMTVAAARAAGMRVNEQVARDQSRKIAAFLKENAERALENEGLPGGVDTVSYILLGLAAEGYASDPTTEAWARYVKNNQAPDGRWTCVALRPPLESSDFEVTAASIRSLKAYGLKSQRPDYDKAIQRAVHWLETAQPNSTEDRAFQILGLVWGGGSQPAIRTSTQRLLALQRSDGGWGQTPALGSDAYATGQALVALREARAGTNGSWRRRGVQYLLNSQLDDGSWHVVSRAAPIQPFFDSDFPHGPDQFISAAASNWASMALISGAR